MKNDSTLSFFVQKKDNCKYGQETMLFLWRAAKRKEEPMPEESGLFERWAAEEELPEPFQRILKSCGVQRYTTRQECCSTHNPVVRGKSASLHPATLRALMFLAGIYEGVSYCDGAVGMQIGDDRNVNYYCLEYEKEEGKIALLYNERNGAFMGCCLQDSSLMQLPSVQKGISSGEEYIALLAYASLQKEGTLYDQEFSENFRDLKSNLFLVNPEYESLLRAAYLCCDNLYRRIESGKSVDEGGIPIKKTQFCGNVKRIESYQLKAGICSPNKRILGEFQILQMPAAVEEKNIEELKEMFYRKRQLSETAKAKIPCLPEDYMVSIEGQEILQMIKNTPARLFMITGGAGVGKTTESRMIAQILGLPYYKLTCGPGTDETDLLVTTVPNMSKPKPEAECFPSMMDLKMDPASALSLVTGTYKDGMKEEEAFQEILHSVYQKGYEKAKAEKDFTMVESAIIQACREPAVLEIQEPAMIENPGTLTKLNALFDDCASTELLHGETIVRHPDTVILMTTNLHYIGCRMFNESILSRMNLIQHRDDLTVAQMVERVIARTECFEIELIRKMAEIIVRIQKHLINEEIQGGVCGYRELENWVWKYMSDKNVLRAVKDTVISKAALLPEDRDEIMECYVLPYFSAA